MRERMIFRMNGRRFANLLRSQLLLAAVLAAGVCGGQEPQLGSTATLEQIQRGFGDQSPTLSVPKFPRQVDLVADPTPMTNRKLEYRFWPDELSLKPGTALIHLDRALVFYQGFNPALLKQWEDYQVALGADSPDPTDLTMRLEPFRNVYDELRRFAECEDQEWDLRLRDLEGVDVYGFLLPEVQRYEDLARLLNFRAIEQLGRRDFEGATASILCGYRLAAFVRQGETLVQQVVGLNIEKIIQGAVEEAIRTPGSPNLYFALASVPHERRAMIRALEFELGTFARALPILRNPAEQNWDSETWKQQWAKTKEELSQLMETLGAEPGFGSGKSRIGVLLAAEIAEDARGSRKRLIQAGFPAEGVAAMCPEQVIAVETARQMNRLRDDLTAAILLPDPAAKQAVDAVMSRLRRESSVPGLRNFGSELVDLLVPAADSALHLEMQVRSIHHRLLTIEAVRDFAGTHENQFPDALAELTDLPPHIDPHTGKLLGYEVKSEPEGKFAEFSIGVVEPFSNEWRIQRLRFRK